MSLLVDIEKDFGSFQLKVSFETGGGALGLLGASGCGKSMTLKCIAGIVTPDRGRIVLDGRTLFDREQGIDLPPQKRRVGYLFQNYALFPHMTVEQNILAGMDRSLPRAERRNRLEELLDRLFLTGLGRRRPAQLSGGQQQRAALGRILASEPAVLLLDEPLSALDSYLKWQVELELMEVLDQFHGPTLFVTHSRDEVYHFCQTVCVLEHGRSQPVETVEQLFSAPETLSACLLSGCKNVSRARPAGEDLVEALDWGVTLRCGRSVPEGLSHIGVRAHFLRPTAEPGPNAIPCRVLRVIDNVFSTVVMLSTPGGRTGFSHLRLELDKEVWSTLGTPEQLFLQVEPQDILLLRDPKQ